MDIVHEWSDRRDRCALPARSSVGGPQDSRLSARRPGAYPCAPVGGRCNGVCRLGAGRNLLCHAPCPAVAGPCKTGRHGEAAWLQYTCHVPGCVDSRCMDAVSLNRAGRRYVGIDLLGPATGDLYRNAQRDIVLVCAIGQTEHQNNMSLGNQHGSGWIHPHLDSGRRGLERSDWWNRDCGDCCQRLPGQRLDLQIPGGSEIVLQCQADACGHIACTDSVECLAVECIREKIDAGPIARIATRKIAVDGDCRECIDPSVVAWRECAARDSHTISRDPHL